MGEYRDYKLAKVDQGHVVNPETDYMETGGLVADVSWADTFRNLGKFSSYLTGEKIPVIFALIGLFVTTITNVLGPYLLGVIIDNYISNKDLNGLTTASLVLAGIYIVSFGSNYLQFILMGKVSQRVLVRLRNTLFQQLQSLPLAFFNQNKSGELISRINSDTDKLNQLLSELILRFAGNFFTILGIGVTMVLLNWKLAIPILAACAGLVVINRILTPFVKRVNKTNLSAVGNLSAEIQEDLTNFKVIIAYNRRDYFRQKFHIFNESSFRSALRASIVNNLFVPIYDLSGNIGLATALLFGITMVASGEITIGVLIAFIAYTDRFYQPLRILASILGNIQVSIAAWERVQQILSLKTNLEVEEDGDAKINPSAPILEFDNVYFGYEPGQTVLEDVSFKIEQGKTYALVGPTGGGKSTTAALMTRLYDPVKGIVRYRGRDMRTYSAAELAGEIGFILQDPMLFTGTVADNIRYANTELIEYTNEQLLEKLQKLNLSQLLERFPSGLETKLSPSTDNISLGQRQLISFMRTMLRQPKLLIMDEATANIDTVTERGLNQVVDQLSNDTTKIVIAHRLNTIANADKIIFINGGHTEEAMSFDQALELITHSQRSS